MPAPRPTIPLTRAADGRWLAGVCAGIADARGLPVVWLRAAFVLAALALGLGVLVYAACALIIPAEDEQPDAGGERAIVVLAKACAACAGLITLAALAATATVFGFGAAVVGVGAAILVAALVAWPRVGPSWALLPLAALALPAVAVAATDIELAPQAARVTVAPGTIADIPADGYRSGLGTLFVDLRETALPASAPLRIRAGVRRTIVALPHDRCVTVRLRYDVNRRAAQAGALLTARHRWDRPFSSLVLFGKRRYADNGGATAARGTSADPTLSIDFRSQGGSLYVRDYPDGVDPQSVPDWPGYPVTLEPRPDTRGVARSEARHWLQAWRVRHREQLRSQAYVDRRLGGPCAARRNQAR